MSRGQLSKKVISYIFTKKSLVILLKNSTNKGGRSIFVGKNICVLYDENVQDFLAYYLQKDKNYEKQSSLSAGCYHIKMKGTRTKHKHIGNSKSYSEHPIC